MAIAFEAIPLARFNEAFENIVELSSVALGGSVCSVSDEFFAEAVNLLKVEPAPSLKGQFGPKGALYSGWESRRHNPAFDWCIIKLGCRGSIVGFDVDTSHFNGNEAPEVSVEALSEVDPTARAPANNDHRWVEVLPKVALGPNSRHVFKIPPIRTVNFVKLNMYPDGGIARFRVYGHVSPVFPADEAEELDLAHVFSGGLTVFTSDQHFGVGSNLLLPGRGKDMGDGWETKRSRQPDHKDWVIIKLGHPGYLTTTEIDTAHFKGNFPDSCELHATNSAQNVPEVPEQQWVTILAQTKLGPHARHFFQLENTANARFTHVRLTIYPDGGVKRVRVYGTRGIPPTKEESAQQAVIAHRMSDSGASKADSRGQIASNHPKIPALPLTSAGFAPFGQVVQAWSDEDGVPKGTKITPANFGSATKFHKLAPVTSSYPAGSEATTGISVFRCKPTLIGPVGVFTMKVLERHPYTNQAFVPMGAAPGSAENSLEDVGQRYLVIVAGSHDDGSPDMKSVRAFVANVGQGIVYNTNVWHHPMIALDTTIDFSCIETQVGDGRKDDCEIINIDKDGPLLVKL